MIFFRFVDSYLIFCVFRRQQFSILCDFSAFRFLFRFPIFFRILIFRFLWLLDLLRFFNFLRRFSYFLSDLPLELSSLTYVWFSLQIHNCSFKTYFSSVLLCRKKRKFVKGRPVFRRRSAKPYCHFRRVHAFFIRNSGLGFGQKVS